MFFITELNDLAKAKVVKIMNKKTEQVLQILSEYYKVHPQQIVVGTIKEIRKSYMLHMFKEKKRFFV